MGQRRPVSLATTAGALLGAVGLLGLFANVVMAGVGGAEFAAAGAEVAGAGVSESMIGVVLPALEPGAMALFVVSGIVCAWPGGRKKVAAEASGEASDAAGPALRLVNAA